MNAAKVAMNGEGNEGHNEELANNTNHNDCGKHCGIVVGGGALPKVRNIVSNIPNGISAHVADDTAKVNNNVMLTENSESAGTSSACVGNNRACLSNNLNFSNGFEARHHKDSYLQNNVNNQTAVDKCPLKVRSCANEDAIAECCTVANGHCKFDLKSGTARSWDDRDDSSSDTGNEGEDGLSADECCIYTYKGDQMADLPSSFFRLDALAQGVDHASHSEGTRREEIIDEHDIGHNAGNSSPEMDFLEMDFDPGPSCEQDSEEDSDRCDIENDESTVVFPDHSEEEKRHETVNKFSGGMYNLNNLSAAGSSRDNSVIIADSSDSTPEETIASSSVHPVCSLQHSVSVDAVNLGGGSSSHTSHSVACRSARDTWGCHSNSGDIGPVDTPPLTFTSAGESGILWDAGVMKFQKEGGYTETKRYDLQNAMYHLSVCTRHDVDKQAAFPDDEELYNDEMQERLFDRRRVLRERVMIWSEHEACIKEVTQISTSACGATAVINALIAFNIPFHVDKVKDSVKTRLRAETGPLPEYLFSRSVAGATHVDIIRGLESASNGILYGRFFHLHPDRNVSLSCWLAYWMRKGAIPILTLNLQQCLLSEHPVPDAWHHQMVFGVSPFGIYLTNPIDRIPETVIWPQLCSPSVLLVRRSDVMTRWTAETNLRSLAMHSDPRWKKMNVLGQVVNMIRETQCSRSQSQGWVVTQHVSIPASYSSGVTLAIRRDAPGFEELRNASELPLLQH